MKIVQARKSAGNSFNETEFNAVKERLEPPELLNNNDWEYQSTKMDLKNPLILVFAGAHRSAQFAKKYRKQKPLAAIIVN